MATKKLPPVSAVQRIDTLRAAPDGFYQYPDSRAKVASDDTTPYNTIG